MADLVAVEIETTLGALYVFPDMPRSVLEASFRSGKWDEGQLTLVNVSGAALVMPNRIVKELRYEGQVHWRGPTNRHK